jgi:hypothetical protein
MWRWRYWAWPASPEQVSAQEQRCEALYYDFRICERMLGFNDSKCRIQQLGLYERCLEQLAAMKQSL